MTILADRFWAKVEKTEGCWNMWQEVRDIARAALAKAGAL